MKGKFLAQRTVAPKLSELFSEFYDLLRVIHPTTKNFTIMIRDERNEIKTRIVPMTDRAIKELFEVSDKDVKYVARTDENNNFIEGEEK